MSRAERAAVMTDVQIETRYWSGFRYGGIVAVTSLAKRVAQASIPPGRRLDSAVCFGHYRGSSNPRLWERTEEHGRPSFGAYQGGKYS